jgi:hypothetical protein
MIIKQLTLLQRRLQGVLITECSGQPGATRMPVLIRGLGTMNTSTSMILKQVILKSLVKINIYILF